MTIVSRKEANGKALAKNKPNRDQLAPDNANSNRVVKLQVVPEKQDELDTILPKFFDFPIAAIRSPPIPVEANNLIRISVLVKRPYASAGGLGGIIVRDSIGGEQFQFRTNVRFRRSRGSFLFRKAPASGTFTVTLGLAGYAEAYFDDFRVEVIEEAGGREDERRIPPDIVQNGRRQTPASPRPPDPTMPAAASLPTEFSPSLTPLHQFTCSHHKKKAGRAPCPAQPFRPPRCCEAASWFTIAFVPRRADARGAGRPSFPVIRPVFAFDRKSATAQT